MHLPSLIFVTGAVAVSAEAAPPSPLWPKPVSEQLGSTDARLSQDFQFIPGQASPFLDRAAARYRNLIFPLSAIADNTTSAGDVLISSCDVQVETIDRSTTPKLGDDEGYELTISAEGKCVLASGTVWGALRGMETFTQLLTRPLYDVSLSHLPVAITDHPRYSHRGLLIDSSRHYLPSSEILSTIDSMVMTKLNVLHWHMVDAQSFPFDPPSAPRLVRGAYSQTAVYTYEEVSKVVQYGADRGVRVLLELDVPGHAASWAEGYPGVMADCFEKYSYNINNFALNPVKEETYALLRGVLGDALKASSSDTEMGGGMLHVGGDEVVYGCWSNDTSIVNYMQENDMSSDELLVMFAQRVDGMLKGSGATAVHWEEVFAAQQKTDEQLDRNQVIFQVWTGTEKLQAVVQEGYRAITSPQDVWYLDHADNTWEIMYHYDPSVGLSVEEAGRVVGGEVAMWGEKVDESNIEGIVYPRACAVGERLWSEESVNDVDEAEGRLEQHRCRMRDRSFRPGAMSPGYCSVTYV